MPDIDSITGDISNIHNEINNFYDEITYLSGCIDELSGQLSGDYWESGGDNSTCYGSSIGNSSGTVVIDLDNQELVSNNGYWYVPYLYSSGTAWFNHVDIGSSWFDSSGDGYIDGDLSVNGTLTVGCSTISTGGAHVAGTMSIDSGCSFLVGCSYLSDGTLCLGHTTLSEAQLSALLQLI